MLWSICRLRRALSVATSFYDLRASNAKRPLYARQHILGSMVDMDPTRTRRTWERLPLSKPSKRNSATLGVALLAGLAPGFVPVVLARYEQPTHAGWMGVIWTSLTWDAVVVCVLFATWLCSRRLTGADRPSIRLAISWTLAAVLVATSVYAPWIFGMIRGTTTSHQVAVPAEQDLLSARYTEVIGSTYPADLRIGVRRSLVADEYALIVPGEQSFLRSAEGWQEFGWPLRVVQVRCQPDHLSYATFQDLCEASRKLEVRPWRLAASVLTMTAGFAFTATLFGTSRRWFRMRRGECPHCGHRLLAEQCQCPECGGTSPRYVRVRQVA